MKKNILITGGTGFLGSAFAKVLVGNGHTVTIFDNNYRGSIDNLETVKNEIEFIQGDIRNPKIVLNACKGKDCVIHLAYINGTEYFYSKPELVLEVGVKGMMNVLDGCIKHNVSELFLASSSEVYNQPPLLPTPESVPLVIPDPKNPRFSYSGGKIISELLVLNYGRKFFKRVVIFRPHNVYGPNMGREHVIPQFILRMNELKKKHGKKFVFPIQGTGKETRGYIFIDDFIRGLELLLAKGKHMEIYNIGSKNEITVADLAGQISSFFDCSITIEPGELLPGSTTRRIADVSKITKLGFKPSVSLNVGLGKTIDWYLQES